MRIVHVRGKARHCKHPGCEKRNNYGRKETGKLLYCAAHKKEGIVLLGGNRCHQPGCFSQAGYGEAGSLKRRFCAAHKSESMTRDGTYVRCTNRGAFFWCSGFAARVLFS